MRRTLLLIALAAVAVLGGRASLDGPGGAGGGERRDAGPPRVVRVDHVVDGDTIAVRTGGRTERVRLIGIDTPESEKPDTPVECGAHAAERALRKRIGRRVRLVEDPTQDRRDRFGRLLAYVETPGGTDLGRAQVRAGWAEVYVFQHDPFARVGAYRGAARKARSEGRGVYGGCRGDFHRGA